MTRPDTPTPEREPLCAFCGKPLADEPCLNCQYPPGSKHNPYPSATGTEMKERTDNGS